MQEKDGNSLREGIWVIDLTVNDQEALKDGEDTYMVGAPAYTHHCNGFETQAAALAWIFCSCARLI